MSGRVGAVVAAAGSGSRLGGPTPKALREVGGIPLLSWSLGFLVAGGVRSFVVVGPPDYLDAAAEAVASSAVAHWPDPVDVTVVAGADTRQASVAVGLAALAADVDVVLVHDAARAFCPAEVVARVVAAVRAGADAVVPVVPVVDTVVETRDGAVVRTVDRDGLRAVQTPQGFDRDVLVRAHRTAGAAATDDASLVAALGVPVTTVDGAPESFKVTGPLDLLVAEGIAARLLAVEVRGA